jgi:hypothetical protein
MRNTVEWVIGRQIARVLVELGISNPLDRYVGWSAVFPPVEFELDRLPHLLVVSPRDRIARVHEVMLVPELEDPSIVHVEDEIDALGLSSLVLDLGGFGGTYPTLVADDASLEWTVATAAEEWLHQYLAFTPLGFALLRSYLGWLRDPDIGTLNETVAGIVSDEIGDAVLQAYYPAHARKLRSQRSVAPASPPDAFNFNREMREIRLRVDALLASGEVDEAERFMEERRAYLASRGYHLRKLNQAYFAFHGSYADEPTSIDPLGAQLLELRRRSSSLKSYVHAVSSITRREQVLEMLEQLPDAGDQRSAESGSGARTGLVPLCGSSGGPQSRG